MGLRVRPARALNGGGAQRRAMPAAVDGGASGKASSSGRAIDDGRRKDEVEDEDEEDEEEASEASPKSSEEASISASASSAKNGAADAGVGALRGSMSSTSILPASPRAARLPPPALAPPLPSSSSPRLYAEIGCSSGSK